MAGNAARMGRGELHRRSKWGNVREGDHLEDRRRRKDNIKIVIRKVGWEH
jgi:hypothetical protein